MCLLIFQTINKLSQYCNFTAFWDTAGNLRMELDMVMDPYLHPQVTKHSKSALHIQIPGLTIWVIMIISATASS